MTIDWFGIKKRKKRKEEARKKKRDYHIEQLKKMTSEEISQAVYQTTLVPGFFRNENKIAFYEAAAFVHRHGLYKGGRNETRKTN